MKINKTLNINIIQKKMIEKGFNQSEVSKRLNVTRETVSKWMKQENLPSAEKSFRLSKLLDLSFDELLKIEYLDQPLVSFRKNLKIKETDKDKELGFILSEHLEKLLPYVPFDYLTKPPILIEPKNNYEYIQKVAKLVRDDMNLKSDKVEYSDMINIFAKYHAVLIPVLWGKRKDNINGIRVFLPETMTNWVYINLDVNPIDFKFWMAHELGHILSPKIDKKESEDFADNFAGALLFPDQLVSDLHEHLSLILQKNKMLTEILKFSEKYFISPYTVFIRLKKFADNYQKKHFGLDDEIYPVTNKFKKKFKDLSESIFNDGIPYALKYIQFSNEVIKTPFFNILKDYIYENKKSATFVKEVLNISISDAKNIYDIL